MKKLVLLTTVVAVVAAGFGLAAPAGAAYKAKVRAGTLTITGNGAGDKLALRLKPGNKNVLQVDVKANGTADFSFDRSRFKRIVVNAGGGNDTVTIVEKNGAFTNKEATTLNGGAGADRLVGGRYAETFAGGLDADTILGKKGNDRVFWTAGEGSDKVNGDQGADVLTAQGTAGSETFVISAVGVRVALTSESNVLDIGKVERIVANGRGAADTLVGQNGLAGLTALTVNGGPGNDIVVGGDGADLLSGGPGDDLVTGGLGNDTISWSHGDGTDGIDGQDGQDVVKIAGSGGADTFAVSANGIRVRVDQTNTGAALDIGTNERIEIAGLGGADTFSATGNMAALSVLRFDGGPGEDTILGGNGLDTLLGGDGKDFIDGNQGNDTVLSGAGDDVVQWDPGDGSDKIEGGTGKDRLEFHASNANEVMDIQANGNRVRFLRNIGAITLDVNDVETLNTDVLGGIDTVTVNALGATDVKNVNLRLSGTLGGTAGDAQADSVILNGTSKKDTVKVVAGFARVDVTGLAAAVHIFSPEPADRLTVNGLGQADKLTGGTGLAVLMGLTLVGGSANDTLTGGDGVDILAGLDGNDVINGGAGNDLIAGGANSDAMNGQAGADNYDCLTPGDTFVQDGTDAVGPACP